MSHRADQSNPSPRPRAMVSAELHGKHTHKTSCGIKVNIYHRDGKFIARGSCQGKPFGPTLGRSEQEAEIRLRQLLTEIENGTFVRPSQAPARVFGQRSVPRLTLGELADLFLAEKRKLRGAKTESHYKSRLGPVIDFSGLAPSLKRWPLAQSIDREFVIELLSYLARREVTRNGQPGGFRKLISAAQIYNVLDCLRTMFNWAKRADNRKLPSDWINPLTADLVGKPPAKDPLRPDPLPLTDRVKLVGVMDRWQLAHLAISLVLPLRPDEVTGVLISEVDFVNGWFIVGSRLGGDDHTKEGVSFHMPFPSRLVRLIRELIGGRAEGPLLRNRRSYERPLGRLIGSRQELESLYQAQLLRAGGEAQATADRKRLFRGLLKQIGGASPDDLGREFKRVLRSAGLENGRSLYDLRHAITRSLKAAGLHEMEMTYCTGHSLNGILHKYTGLDPVAAMQGYFDAIDPLLEAIEKRSCEVGVRADNSRDELWDRPRSRSILKALMHCKVEVA